MRAHLAFLFSVLVVIAGCSAMLPDGRFACDSAHACPSGFSCVASRCYRLGADASVDASPDDAMVPRDATDAAIPRGDAGCPGVNGCISAIVTNAYPATQSMTGLTVTFGSTVVPVPAYGETSGPWTLPLDATGHLSGSITALAQPFTLVATAGSSYVLVGAASGVQLLPLDGTVPTRGVSVAFVDFMADTADINVGVVGSVTTPLLLSPGNRSTWISFMGNERLVVSHVGAISLAAFAAALDLPPTGAYYVFLAGDPTVHLGAPGGIRAIAAVVGSTAIRSRPLYWLTNATPADLQLCVGTTSIVDVVATSDLVGPFVGFDAMGHPLTIDVRPVVAGSPCMGMPVHTAPVMAAGPPAIGRTLVAVTGVADPASWIVTAMREPPPDTTSSLQSITFLNGTSIALLYSADGGPTFSDLPSQAPGRWAATRRPVVPIVIGATDGANPEVYYEWIATSQVAWGITTTGLVEVDAPFGRPWSLGYQSVIDGTCPGYCAAVQTKCPAPNTQYADLGVCLAACGGLGWGLTGGASDTIACRTAQANAVTVPTANVVCQRAGPLGGSACGTSPCAVFCAANLAVCTAAQAAYASSSECMSACAALGDHLDVPAISQTSGNTLACRTYYLERVPHDPATNCPLTAVASARCN